MIDPMLINDPPAIVITYDRGGRLIDYYNRINRNRTRRVIINGSCLSACTLWTSVPNICVTTQAIMMFHAARNIETNDISYIMSEWMMGQYPRQLQDYINAHGGIYNGDIWVNYSELRNIFPTCRVS
jgi:hypothetical protein